MYSAKAHCTLDLATVVQGTVMLPIPASLSRFASPLSIYSTEKNRSEGRWGNQWHNQSGTTNFLLRAQLEAVPVITSIFTANCRRDTDHAEAVFLYVATEHKL